MLDVQNLCKSIAKKVILEDLSFSVSTGEFLILLGGNGEGKTLLLNILATLVKPTSGRVTISKLDAFSNLNLVRPQIGYLPASFEGYPNLSVVDYLNFFASAYKLDKQERTGSIDSVLDLMDISHLRDTSIGKLSSGQRKRLLFAKTFLHDPQLWILDDPFSPLDTRGQMEMVELLNELKVIGKTLVIATNRIEDVSKLCEMDVKTSQDTHLLGILSKGKFTVFNSIHIIQQELKEQNNIEHLKPNWLSELYLEVTKS